MTLPPLVSHVSLSGRDLHIMIYIIIIYCTHTHTRVCDTYRYIPRIHKCGHTSLVYIILYTSPPLRVTPVTPSTHCLRELVYNRIRVLSDTPRRGGERVRRRSGTIGSTHTHYIIIIVFANVILPARLYHTTIIRVGTIIITNNAASSLSWGDRHFITDCVLRVLLYYRTRYIYIVRA